MLWEYKGIVAELSYSAATKCYYGEFWFTDQLICIQASTKEGLIAAMQNCVDHLGVVIPEV